MKCLIAWLLLTTVAHADEAIVAHGCGEMEVFNYSEWMCKPLAMPDMPMSMFMVHGNAFVTDINAEGARGGQNIASTNMLMADLGTSIGSHHYLDVELMATAEKWTMPSGGFPELGQVGDYQQDGTPFVDHQHPHSSPAMGLTVSDTITLDSSTKTFLDLSYAPRGQATYGPVSFMHRPTGEVNPLTPLGHHVGQDEGHVTSSVFAATFGYHGHRIEFSTFSGEEPSPTRVDMPTAAPDSYAGRLTLQLTRTWSAMVSGAYLDHPDHFVPQISHYSAYSASSYNSVAITDTLEFQNAFIYGILRNEDDHASFAFLHADCVGNIPVVPGQTPVYPALNSFAEEFMLQNVHSRLFGRAEVLQRTPLDLYVNNDPTPALPRWISAYTIGYTHRLLHTDGVEIGLGASITRLVLPIQWQPFYGGNPYSENVFLQVSGMKMWSLL